jgi:hypothetical protein
MCAPVLQIPTRRTEEIMFARFAITLLFSTVTIAASTLAQAQGLIFSNDALNAFASTPDLSISVFAQRSQDPSGTSGFAVFNLFNLSTFEFTQCQNGNFALTVLPTSTTLSFVTEGGFNCPVGQQIVVSCAVTSNSGILHNVTNGTAKLGFSNQQFTTHGVANTYTDLTCNLSGLGVQLFSDGGSASTMQNFTTP